VIKFLVPKPIGPGYDITISWLARMGGKAFHWVLGTLVKKEHTTTTLI
jgi:hypothetical protein